MKPDYKKYYFSLTAAICFSILSVAQGNSKGYKENIEMNFDSKGIINVVSTIKYNASVWDYMKQQHGTDPSVLKNVIKRQFPKYQITDYDIKNDEMERTSTIKFSILGALKVNENGKWIAELDSKNPDITKISETQFLLVEEEEAQTSKINLPKSAAGAKIEKDSFGKAILTYSAPIGGGGIGNFIKYLGFITIAAGGFLFYKNSKLNPAQKNNSGNQTIGYRQPKQINESVTILEPEPQKNLKENK